MFRLAPLLVFLICALMFISGTRYFAPSPLDLLLGARIGVERRVEITIVQPPRQIEANESLSEEANETSRNADNGALSDLDNLDNLNDLNDLGALGALTQEETQDLPAQTEQPITPQPTKQDALQKLLNGLGYPFASGDLQKRSCANGQTCAINGVLRGLNFSELYCRAVAFSNGREMPKYAPSPSQNFETLQFWLSKRPAGLDAIYLVSDPFVLSGSLFTEKGALQGSLSLSYNARWRFPCEMSESWQSVSLPLRCVARRRQASLDCSLDLRALIESLSGVAAKASEPARRKQIDELHENLQEQFKRRVRERPNIEEIDLRYLF
ncbi:MAG: hypothetical protein LBC09_03555 [Helicobacteraceae bacterium]|jgi:hypothetical protein|nr:hypothetical protein [Helicobacteraceae bacterium]